MPPRQTVLKPLGLITRPNELGAYPPGAMAVANNVLFRDSGQFQVSKNTSSTQLLGAANDVVRKLFPLDSGIIWSATRTAADVWTLAFSGTAGVLPSAFSGGAALMSDTGFIAPIRMRDHFLVNTLRGVIVSDVMAPASVADRTFRMAGLHQALVTNIIQDTVSPGAVLANTTVGYCVLFRRDYANGYSVISTPSPVYRFINAGITCNAQITVVFAVNGGLAAGDLIEIYRTDAVNAVLATTDPGTTCKLVLTYTLTGADIAATTVTLTDTAAPGPLGETYGRELYTNPGQGGALSANRQPNISNIQSSYKGFAFTANVTERPIWAFSVPAGVSNNSPGLVTAYERQYGIGVRQVSGLATIGNDTITGVSATHLLGIVPNQMVLTPFTFPAGTTVLAAGAGNIQFSQPSTVGGVTAITVADQLQVDNTPPIIVTGLGTILADLGSYLRYEITVDQTVAARMGGATYAASGFTMTVEPYRPYRSTTISARGTNGRNYRPPIPELASAAVTFTRTPRPNMLQWSHEQQPEHVPPSNSAFVGSGIIIGLASTRDALWIFCTDGLFRLSGDGGQWRIDQLDTTLVLSAPQCATVLRDSVYAYTNRGLVRIADDGFDEISDLTIGDILPGPAYVETAALIVERDETYDEIHVIDTGVTGGAPLYYLYNTIHRCWSKLSFATVTALAYQRIPTNPATQPNGWVVIGQSPLGGLPPQYSLFDQNVTATNLTAIVQEQPFYGEEPIGLKHWIDATWIFDIVDATRFVNSSWRGVADGSAVLVAWLNGDARATFGIPRRVAVAPTLSPGITIVGGGVFTPPTCKGVSVRFQPLTEQQAYR